MNLHMREQPVICGQNRMDAAAVAGWAAEHIPQGWILAESPERVVWKPFDGQLKLENPESILRMVIFSPEAEIRLEKAYGAHAGPARTLLLDKNGKPTWERFSSCLVNGGGRVEYVEHFRPDENSGLMRFVFARFSGVSAGGK